MADELTIVSEQNPGKVIEYDYDLPEDEHGVFTVVVHTIDLLEAILKDEGFEKYQPEGQCDYIKLNNGLILLPRFVEAVPMGKGQFRTTTTIEVKHAEKFAGGFFEFQHAASGDREAAVISGFEAWVCEDLGAILDTLEQNNQYTSHLKLDAPSRKGSRVAVLGPINHRAARQPETAPEHPFCPCCFTTNTISTFKEHFRSHKVFAIRFFAARDGRGNLQADCRINGLPFEERRQALLEYAAGWPDLGLEVRKQYVIISDWGV